MSDSYSASYAAAGVDITAGYKAVELMKSHIARTLTSGVCSDVGGFGGLFELDTAGMAAHLAGAMAAGTTLPVIGIPLSSAHLDGMDALLSTVQMPSGIPVATVAIDGAKNAAILAVEILALGDEELTEKLEVFRAKGTQEALEKDRALNSKE